MKNFQCPYFLKPCPLVSVPNGDQSSLPDLDPRHPPPSPPPASTLLPSFATSSQLAPPSLPRPFNPTLPSNEELPSQLSPTLYSSYPPNSSVDSHDYDSSFPFSSESLPFPPFNHLSNSSTLDLFHDRSLPYNFLPTYTSSLNHREASSNNDDLFSSSSSTPFPSSASSGEGFGARHGFQGREGLVSLDAIGGDESEEIATRRASVSPLPDSARSTQFGEGLLGEQTSFVSKLWHILTHDEYEQYLRWSSDGTSMILVDPDKFAEVVLPRFFRHGKLSSFLRQLNNYSFHRGAPDDNNDTSSSSSSHYQPSVSPSEVSSPSSSTTTRTYSGGTLGDGGKIVSIGFTHPLFRRNHPELLSQVRPRFAGKNKRSSSGPPPPRRNDENLRTGTRRRTSR